MITNRSLPNPGELDFGLGVAVDGFFFGTAALDLALDGGDDLSLAVVLML